MMSNNNFRTALNQIAQTLGSQWSNHARLIKIRMPQGISMLVENLEGIESILGQPVPPQGQHLLPDPQLYPPQLNHNQTYNLDQQARLLFAGFRYQVHLLSEHATYNTSDWLNQPVSVSLQTDQLGQTRPIHGFITAAHCMGSNGGLTRYQITIEPWTAYLRLTQHNQVYLRQNVASIIQTLCEPLLQHSSFENSARLSIDPACFDIAPFVQITQYEESNWHFIQRLLQQAGLVAWFSHQTEQHTLHIEPSAQRLQQQDTQQLHSRYHRQSAVEQHDGVQSLQPFEHYQYGGSEWGIYDPRNIEAQFWQANGQGNTDYYRQAPLAQWSEQDAIQQIANHWQIGQQQQRAQLKSSIRRLGSMYNLILNDYARSDANELKILSVYHQARNNLSVEIGSVGSAAMASHQQHQFQAFDWQSTRTTLANNNDQPTTDFYQNHALVLVLNEDDNAKQTQSLACYIDASVPDGHWLHRPRTNNQNAIVVGKSELPHDTERNHRLKIQYHWQRGESAQQQSQIDHPQLNNNAPANDSSSLWVPVATGSSGDHMGNHLLPRKGQEIELSFIDHDIDHPIVLGSLYNGQGQAGQKGNLLSSGLSHVTSNSPAWSHTEQQADVVRGIKTQSMNLSQSGDGNKASNLSGYNQLAFDQSPQAWRIELSSTSHHSQLQLGSLKQQQDMHLKENRGNGFAVETEAAVNLRAEQGQLLSSHTNNLDQYMQVQSLTQLQQASQSIEQWQQQATTHQAVGVSGGDKEQANNSDGTLTSAVAQSVHDSMQSISINASDSHTAGSDETNSDNQHHSQKQSDSLLGLDGGLSNQLNNNIAQSMGSMGGIAGGIQTIANTAVGMGIDQLSHSLTDQLGEALSDALKGLQDKFGEHLSPAINKQLQSLLSSNTDLDQLAQHLNHILPKESSLQQRIMGHLKNYLGNSVAKSISGHLNQAVSGQIQSLTGGLLGQKQTNQSINSSQAISQNTSTQQSSTHSEESGSANTTANSSGLGWSSPSIVIEAPSLSALLTPQHLSVLSTGQISSQSDTLDILSQGQLHQLARENIELFAAKDMRITAANGRLRAIAHTGQLRLDARQDVNIASRADLIIQAPDTIKLIAGGSGIEISGGNVTLTSGGKIQMLAGQKKHVSGGGAGSGAVDIKQSEMKGCAQMKASAAQQQSATVELG